MIDYNGTPFQYNPTITNVNIDNQLTGILSQFDDNYIMDVIKESLENRFRPYDLPRPNIIASFETTFKQLTDGFSSNTDEILETRKRTYLNIIDTICDYYNFEFIDRDDTDYYSAAFWLYNFLVANFTENLKNFYVSYLIREKDSLDSALGLTQLRKENDVSYTYSKRLFKDPKLAAIHCNIEYVVEQMSTFSIDLWDILNCVYSMNPNIPNYIFNLVKDNGNFFKDHYTDYLTKSKDAADVLIYIKLSLQQIGGAIEPTEE